MVKDKTVKSSSFKVLGGVVFCLNDANELIALAVKDIFAGEFSWERKFLPIYDNSINIISIDLKGHSGEVIKFGSQNPENQADNLIDELTTKLVEISANENKTGIK